MCLTPIRPHRVVICSEGPGYAALCSLIQTLHDFYCYVQLNLDSSVVGGATPRILNACACYALLRLDAQAEAAYVYFLVGGDGRAGFARDFAALDEGRVAALGCEPVLAVAVHI